MEHIESYHPCIICRIIMTYNFTKHKIDQRPVPFMSRHQTDQWVSQCHHQFIIKSILTP